MNIESAAGVIFPESQMGKILQIRFETKTFTTLRSFYCIGNCNGDEDRLIFRLTNVADFDGKRIKYFPVPVFLFDDTKKTANMLSNELAGEGGNTIKFQDQHPAFHGVKNAPVHGFETVTHVRNGPADDDAQGILKIGFLDFFFDGNQCAHSLLRSVVRRSNDTASGGQGAALDLLGGNHSLQPLCMVSSSEMQ